MFKCHRGHIFPTHRGTMVCPKCGLRYRQGLDGWVMEDGPKKDAYLKEMKEKNDKVWKAVEETRDQCRYCETRLMLSTCMHLKGNLEGQAMETMKIAKCPHRKLRK